MAPLTGIAFASNWLISKLNLNRLAVKTTRMTTNQNWLNKTHLSGLMHLVITTIVTSIRAVCSVPVADFNTILVYALKIDGDVAT